MTIARIETADALLNAGITGFVNILKDANITSYKCVNNYVEFDISILENFHHYYFDYFANRYKELLSHTFIVTKGKDFLYKKEWDDKTIEDWNKYIERAKKNLKSNSYTAAYKMMSCTEVDLVEMEKKLKKLKLKKNQTVSDIQNEIHEQIHYLKTIIEFLEKEEVGKFILAKNIAYTIIENFWGGVSFLYKSKEATTADIFEEYKKYFINPVKFYYEEDHTKDKYVCFISNQPIKKTEKPYAYGMSWLTSMGVDMGKKKSHFWNLQSNTCYISPLINFIYSCIPAGFTFMNNQGYFVNCNSSVEALTRLNNNHEMYVIKSDDNIQLLEARTYYQLIDFMENQKNKKSRYEIDNIQVIKFSNTDNKTDNFRPYTYNVLSKDKLEVIKRHQKSLSNMISKVVKTGDGSYLRIYQNVMERLYSNKNQFDLIGLLCRTNLPNRPEEPIRSNRLILDILYLNNSFIGTIVRNQKEKEDGSMSVYYSYVNRETIAHMENAGRKLAYNYKVRNASNKLGGITYRLLNALKTKDTGKFMDTFINAHLYAAREGELIIPPQMTEALTDEDKLQTLGYAFVLGLRSGLNPKGDKKEEDENE
ncbi:type I-B CRISPR-associated protein Cas8b1/Cst1 [Niallia sp. JL1B1071]|uniref:type I-B CRISPR-associated protein Cas8b1/Cst1 n=1 Tax=Niallia tiangongensis TaxID=3237105 RepID=UPI0037DCE2C2